MTTLEAWQEFKQELADLKASIKRCADCGGKHFLDELEENGLCNTCADTARERAVSCDED